MTRPTPTPRAAGILVPPLVFFLFVVGAWQLAVVSFEIPVFLLPSPLDVIHTAWERRVTLSMATAITGAAAILGFTLSTITGCLVAFAFSQSAWIRRACFPYAIFLQTVPIVAIAPLIIIWFGTGFRSVTLVAFMVSLFPIITNATTGLTTIDRNQADLFRLYGASRSQTLFKLRLPAAVPYIIAGAKTSSGMAVIGAIVGEFFAGYGARIHGLGYVFIVSSAQMKTAELFAAILCSTALGLLIFSTVGFVGARILRHWYREQTHE